MTSFIQPKEAECPIQAEITAQSSGTGYFGGCKATTHPRPSHLFPGEYANGKPAGQPGIEQACPATQPGKFCSSTWPAYIYSNRHGITAAERLSVVTNLRELWQNHAEELPVIQLKHLARVSEYLCDWPLLSEVSRYGMSNNACNSGNFIHQNILASWHTLDHQRSRDIAWSRLLLQPSDTRAFDLYRALITWKTHCSHQCLGAFDYLQQGELLLEPLGHHHCESFLWQYLDSGIPQWCNLPIFDSADDWHLWLNEELDTPGKRTFSVLHRDWGLIGVVSLTQVHDIGIFYYWIGPDFQGQGYGPQAVEMLLRHARQHAGLNCCFAKAYCDNFRSLTGLAKLGFVETPFHIKAPWKNEKLLYLGPNKQPDKLRSEVFELLDFLQSDIEID